MAFLDFHETIGQQRENLVKALGTSHPMEKVCSYMRTGRIHLVINCEVP